MQCSWQPKGICFNPAFLGTNNGTGEVQGQSSEYLTSNSSWVPETSSCVRAYPLRCWIMGCRKGARSGRGYWGLQEAAMDHPRYRSLSAFSHRYGCVSEHPTSSVLGRSIQPTNDLREGSTPLPCSQWSMGADHDNIMNFSTGKGDQLFCAFLIKVQRGYKSWPFVS